MSDTPPPRGFLRQMFSWLLVPLIIFAVIIAALFLLTRDDGMMPFLYSLF